jgi:hypothetical protein
MPDKAQTRSFSLSMDRIEENWAVLVTHDGQTFDVPRSLLPADAVEGSRLECSMTLQTDETSSMTETIRAQIKHLSEEDDGSDIIL